MSWQSFVQSTLRGGGGPHGGFSFEVEVPMGVLVFMEPILKGDMVLQ